MPHKSSDYSILQDINKWLDDAPKLSEFSSGSDSPVFRVSASDSSRPAPKGQTPPAAGAAAPAAPAPAEAAARKRPSTAKLFGPARPKKVQRTIDRLQPGKSKGNLLSKKPPLAAVAPALPPAPSNESASSAGAGLRQSALDNEPSDEPKLSLGTVLKNADSIQLICKSLVSSPNPHLSNDDEEGEAAADNPATPKASLAEEQPSAAKKLGPAPAAATSKPEKAGKKPNSEEPHKPKSATPNLSAWWV